MKKIQNNWDDMNKAMNEMMNQPALDLSETANYVEKYLRDIYTR